MNSKKFNLKQSLKEKRFVVTSEVQVSLGDEDPDTLIESLAKEKEK